MLGLVRRALRRPHRRLRRVETALFDAYARGGARQGEALVLPLGYFDQPNVRAHVLGWLAGDHALDTGLLRDAWSARRRDGEPEAAFFENLATFAGIAYDLRPHGAATRRGEPTMLDARSQDAQ